MSLIERGLEQGFIRFDDDRKYVTYVYQGKRRNYRNPEEQVQVETFLKLIFIYGYNQEQIRLFVPVTMGSTVKQADLIVYNDNECLSPHIIVECKKQEVSESEFVQAVEQCFSYAVAEGARYVWITSGIKDEYYQVSMGRTKERITVPDIPQSGVETLARFKYAKGGGIFNGQNLFELAVIREDELTRRFKQAHQSLWGGGELDPSRAFDELDKLIFCKLWDEKKAREPGEPYDFQIITVIPRANETEEDRKKRENQELSDRIKALYEEGRQEDEEVFKDDIHLSPEKLRTVVGYLEGVNLNDTDLDSKGRAFETFMGSFFRGDFGQFFTPRQVVKFIVEVLPIRHNSLVLDTSCGSGGFLLYALDKVRREAVKFYPNFETDLKQYNLYDKHWHNFAANNLFGIEINEQIARVAKMNMIIHDDGHTNIIAADGLQESQDLINLTGNSGFSYNRFNFIITNPPFGSIIKQTEKAYMHQYGFAIKPEDWLTPRSRSTLRDQQESEVLFIEQCHRFLVEGGYLAIVLPDGILTNSSLQYVRDGIEERFRIIAVISLPQMAFKKKGAGVKTSILFLKKYSELETNKIRQFKMELQEEVKNTNNYLTLLDIIENDKKQHLSDLRGLDNPQNLSGTSLKNSEFFKEWKRSVVEKYNEQIESLKEKLSEQYIEAKQKKINNYPVFMAIADEIGYDSTGRLISNNDLDFICLELKNFIENIESGKDSFFLSHNVNKEKIFLVNTEELQGRIDPSFYIPSLVQLDKKIKLKTPYTLRDFAKYYSSGATPDKNEEDYYSDNKNGVPFVRVQNLSSIGELDQDDLVYISQEIHDSLLKRSQIKEGDLLIKITGVGRMAVSSVVPENFEGNINQHIVMVCTESREISENIAAFLNLDCIERIASKRATGGTRPALDYSSLFSIPIINDRKIYEAVRRTIDANKHKELEAQQLLDSIDNYLLEELGISIPEPEENTVQNRIFFRNLQDVSGDRYDPYYYKSYFLRIVENLGKSKYSICKLKEITESIVNGYDYRDFSDSGRIYLRVSNIRKNEFNLNLENTKFIPEFIINKDIALLEDDLLLTRKGSFGISVVVDEFVNSAIISSEIFRIRFRDFTSVNSHYISVYLNSKIGQIYFDRIKTGAIMGHISQEALKEYPIILPPLKKQVEISNYIIEIRNRAKQLQQQVKDDLEKVKQEIESMILNSN